MIELYEDLPEGKLMICDPEEMTGFVGLEEIRPEPDEFARFAEIMHTKAFGDVPLELVEGYAIEEFQAESKRVAQWSPEGGVQLLGLLGRAGKRYLLGCLLDGIHHAPNLAALLQALQTLGGLLAGTPVRSTDVLNWDSLPTFGGAEVDLHRVWSWDEKSLLVGSCLSELCIVQR